MDPLQDLSPAACILLAASYASDSNIAALYKLTPSRPEVFDCSLVLRVLLTLLPESLDPEKYTTYIEEVATRIYLVQHEELTLDLTPIRDLSEADARRQVKKLHLYQLDHPSIAEGAIKDPLVLFLIHRAHRIDSETGLLSLLQPLLAPFLDRSTYLRDWFISAVLPLTRLENDYYPDVPPSTTLSEFETLAGPDGLDTLLSKTEYSWEHGTATSESVGRDFRGLLGPWIHGSSQRKKRKLMDSAPKAPAPIGQTDEQHESNLREKPDIAAVLDDWQPAFRWIVKHSIKDFELSTLVVEGWNGPSDVDMGGYQKVWRLDQKDDELANQLRTGYCQSALASVYACESDSSEALDGAHTILVQLAHLMDFEPPPDLATSIHALPKVERHSEELEESSKDYLKYETLIAHDNPLTKPTMETFSLLQMLVYSSYQLRSLGNALTVVKVAQLRFWSDETEQLRIIRKVLHGLTNGPSRDERRWAYVRDTILWLWHWAIEQEEGKSTDGYGVFGKLARHTIEREVLKAFCLTGHTQLAMRTYFESELPEPPLPLDEVEEVVVELILQHYDKASNGNRTRGAVKKAADLLAIFQARFPHSRPLRRCSALIAATHGLSFYSLRLQHGVPFQPVNIRVNEDPLSLVGKVLEQNMKSYTKLDDFIEIGRNLVAAGLVGHREHGKRAEENLQPDMAESTLEQEDEDGALRNAERRVISMAVEAALAEDDFETAYSYVINRLTPSPNRSGTSTNQSPADEDDISWRAAFIAGRFRSGSAAISSFPTSSSSASSPPIRRLEQRMEMLSQSLLLAPPSALPEVLAAWRRCEEELLAAVGTEAAAEHEFDERADRGEVATTHIPGGFGEEDVFSVQPKRKELGRGAIEEAPMGLFEVARGAAAAFGRSAGGVVGEAQKVARAQARERADERDLDADVDGDARVRKRDLVANVVTGGLASGIGWMLGATPVHAGADGQAQAGGR